MPIDLESEKQEPSKSQLERIVALANEQSQLEKEADALAEQMKLLNEKISSIRGGFGVEGRLPTAMQEAGVEEITLDNGAKVKVIPELQPPSLAKDAPNRDFILDWFDKHGQGGAIKDQIQIPFDKGDERVVELVKKLVEMAITFDRYRTIHPATFKKLIGEMLADGDEIPLDELNIQQFIISKVIFKKEKKGKAHAD